MPTVNEAEQAGIKRRAARRGLRSINGRFYHTIEERNRADRAYNKAVEAVKQSKSNQSEANQIKAKQSKAAPFDFAYKQKEIIKPAEATYHCVNCREPIGYKAVLCPKCHERLNWEGL